MIKYNPLLFSAENNLESIVVTLIQTFCFSKLNQTRPRLNNCLFAFATHHFCNL